MAAALAIPAIIGAGTSIIGGIQGRNAAKNAANAQVAGANQAAGMVRGAADQVNPLIAQAATSARDRVIDTSGAAGNRVVDTAGAAGNRVFDTSNVGAGYLRDAASNAAAGMTSAAGQANEFLNPYINAGGGAVTSLSQMLGPGGDLSKSFTAADMEQYDPGYQFRLEQGQKALERSAAARGAAQGGGAMKAITDYAQNAASSEYGAAFDRFLRGKTTTFSMLSGLAGMGLQAGGQAGNNLTGAARYNGDIGFAGEQAATGLQVGAARYMGDTAMDAERFRGSADITAAQYGGNAEMHAADSQAANTMTAARYAGDAAMGAGNARAAGDVGAANSWNGMLSGVGKSVGDYYGMKSIGSTMSPTGPNMTRLPMGRSRIPGYPA